LKDSEQENYWMIQVGLNAEVINSNRELIRKLDLRIEKAENQIKELKEGYSA